MNNTAINYRDLPAIRKAGLAALKKELGGVGAVYFLRQFSAGSGDYTKERKELLANDTPEEVLKGIRDMEAKRKTKNYHDNTDL
ncbi:MAG: hypothetical protein LBS74_08120 [Oscillospiraceae bacterium]|jgi:hypothetical protein|nr:hypothetical protein [Oscillospiraceae bacterium]